MQTEIEAKFLNVNHDTIRKRLAELGAKLEKPQRLMVRTVFDYSDHRIERVLHGRLRVRNEGDKVTVTYKGRNPKLQYAHEIETTVGSYETMVEILRAIGLRPLSVQETKRETWRLDDVEIMLDEWPWVKPFIEIEGKTEAAIQKCAHLLGLKWAIAVFGAAETVYRAEYPGIAADETIGEIDSIKFGELVPDWLERRRKV